MQTTSQTLVDGARNFVIRLTGLGDGTGVQQTLVKVINVATMTPPAGPSFKIKRADFRVFGGIVELLWEAPTPVVFAELTLADDIDWEGFSAQSTRGISGATGSVLLSTKGFDVGSSYDLTFGCIKGV